MAARSRPPSLLRVMWSLSKKVRRSPATVIEGSALVDESAITGESAPALRDSGSERGAVMAGTRVLSGRIVVEVRRTR
jgi:high-affinity K+ transport system ATPase subunit B